MEAKIEAARKFNYKPQNHNYAPVYVAGFGITPAPPPLPPLSTKILARTAAKRGPHEQLQSPLFNILYAELRNLIFIYALTEYEDRTRTLSKHTRYYRPGWDFAAKLSASLLLTCRRVYVETHLAPVALNEHVFWIDAGRLKLPSGSFSGHYASYFDKMTPSQRKAVERVRMFTELSWLEDRRAPNEQDTQPSYWSAIQPWTPGLAIPSLTITIRHTDWRNWQRKQTLELKDPSERRGDAEGWGGWIASVPGLKELIIELETTEAKKDELEKCVRAASGWKFPLANGCLMHDGKKAVESDTWLASAALETPGARRVLDKREREAAEETQLDEKHSLNLKILSRKLVFSLA